LLLLHHQSGRLQPMSLVEWCETPSQGPPISINQKA
jgi:hypothetical protein